MYSRFRQEIIADYLKIEEQHRHIDEAMTRFSKIIGSSDGDYAQAAVAFDELELCIEAHLAHEEKIMAIMKYGNIYDHESHHKSCLHELEFQRSKLRGSPVSVCSDVMVFIGRWLNVHQREHDDPLKSFLMRSIGRSSYWG